MKKLCYCSDDKTRKPLIISIGGAREGAAAETLKEIEIVVCPHGKEEQPCDCGGVNPSETGQQGQPKTPEQGKSQGQPQDKSHSQSSQDRSQTPSKQGSTQSQPGQKKSPSGSQQEGSQGHSQQDGSQGHPQKDGTQGKPQQQRSQTSQQGSSQGQPKKEGSQQGPQQKTSQERPKSKPKRSNDNADEPVIVGSALLPEVSPRYHGSACCFEVSILEKHNDKCEGKKSKNPRRTPDDASGSYEVIGRMVFKTCNPNVSEYSESVTTAGDEELVGESPMEKGEVVGKEPGEDAGSKEAVSEEAAGEEAAGEEAAGEEAAGEEAAGEEEADEEAAGKEEVNKEPTSKEALHEEKAEADEAPDEQPPPAENPDETEPVQAVPSNVPSNALPTKVSSPVSSVRSSPSAKDELEEASPDQDEVKRKASEESESVLGSESESGSASESSEEEDDEEDDEEDEDENEGPSKSVMMEFPLRTSRLNLMYKKIQNQAKSLVANVDKGTSNFSKILHRISSLEKLATSTKTFPKTTDRSLQAPIVSSKKISTDSDSVIVNSSYQENDKCDKSFSNSTGTSPTQNLNAGQKSLNEQHMKHQQGKTDDLKDKEKNHKVQRKRHKSSKQAERKTQ